MRKILAMALLALVATSANAQEKAEKKNPNKPVFSVVKENKITSIKNQSRSGTCWDYSTLSFFEAEILKNTGKTYDLCESFVANKTYMDRAIQVVRLHGDCQFAQGGSAYDPLFCLQNYGICPEDAMPFPGSLYGDSLNNYNELFSIMTPYVQAVAKSDAKKLSNQWKVGLQGILDAYLGKCPENFMYQGKSYTPKSFAASLGLNFNDYVTITSYTHHPFWTSFAVEVQDNWRNAHSWNLPMEDMLSVIDNAVMNGYTIAWGGDVSEEGFTRQGLAYAYDTKKAQSLTVTYMARLRNLANGEQSMSVDSVRCLARAIDRTQKTPGERAGNWERTGDRGSLIDRRGRCQGRGLYEGIKIAWAAAG